MILSRNKKLSKSKPFQVCFAGVIFFPLAIFLIGSILFNPLDHLLLVSQGTKEIGAIYEYSQFSPHVETGSITRFVFVPDSAPEDAFRPTLLDVPIKLQQEVAQNGKEVELPMNNEFQKAKALRVQVEYLPSKPSVHSYPDYPRSFFDNCFRIAIWLNLLGLCCIALNSTIPYTKKYLWSYLGRRKNNEHDAVFERRMTDAEASKSQTPTQSL